MEGQESEKQWWFRPFWNYGGAFRSLQKMVLPAASKEEAGELFAGCTIDDNPLHFEGDIRGPFPNREAAANSVV